MKPLLPLTLSICLAVCFLDIYGQTYTQLSTPQKLAGQQMYILPKATFKIEVQIVSMEYSPGYLFWEKDYDSLELDTLSRAYGVNANVYKALKQERQRNENYKGPYKISSLSEDSLKVSTLASPDYEKIFYIASTAKWNKNQTVTFTYANDGILAEGESALEDKTFDLVVKTLSSAVSIAAQAFKGVDKKDDPKSNLSIPDLNEAIDAFDKLDGQNNFEVYKDLKSTYEKQCNKVFGEYFYTTKKKVRSVVLYYTPKGSPGGTDEEFLKTVSVPLFRFDSVASKIIINDRLKDEIWGKDLTYGPVGEDNFSLELVPFKEQQLSYHLERGSTSTGIAYNVPIRAEFKLTNPKQKIVIHEVVKIPQLGKIGFTHNRKREKLVFSLDPLTGELKKLSIEGKAVLTDQISNTSTQVTDAIKLVQGDDADTELQKEVTRLENVKKKRDLLNELGIE